MQRTGWARLAPGKAGLFAIALCVVCACDAHTEMSLVVEGGSVSTEEIRRVTEVAIASPTRIEQEDGKWVVEFGHELPTDEQATLKRVLDRAVTVKQGAPPKASLEIKEDDPEVLKAVGKQTGDRTEFEFRRAEGEVALMAQGEGMTRKQLCVWNVPIEGSLPALNYGIDVNADGEANPEMRGALNKLAESIGNLSMVAKHEITFADPALQPAAEKLVIVDAKSVMFVFEEEDKPSLGGFPEMAFPSDIAECFQTIVSESDDAFFGSFLFPELSAQLESHGFENKIF